MQLGWIDAQGAQERRDRSPWQDLQGRIPLLASSHGASGNSGGEKEPTLANGSQESISSLWEARRPSSGGQAIADCDLPYAEA